MIVTTLFVEGMLMVAAVALLPFAAREEPVVQSWRQAVRIAWLHTGHAAWLVGLIALGVRLELFLTRLGWSSSTMVWLADNGSEVLGLLGFALAIWYVVAMLRAAIAPRETPDPKHPPTCEFCGYDLTTRALTDACPECGRIVVDSLGPDVRPGCDWDRTGGLTSSGFLTSAGAAWFRPEPFFRSVRTVGGIGKPLAFLCLQLTMTAAVFFVTVFACVGAIDELPSDWGWGFAFMSLALSGLCAVFIALETAAYGAVVSRRVGRNRFSAVARVACYLSGIWPPWAFAGTAIFVAVMEWLDSSRGPGRWEVIAIISALFGPTLFFTVLFIGGIHRRARYVQFANR